MAKRNAENNRQLAASVAQDPINEMMQMLQAPAVAVQPAADVSAIEPTKHSVFLELPIDVSHPVVKGRPFYIRTTAEEHKALVRVAAKLDSMQSTLKNGGRVTKAVHVIMWMLEQLAEKTQA